MDELPTFGLSLKDLSASEFSRLSALWDHAIDLGASERDAWFLAIESEEPRLGPMLREMFALLGGEGGRRFLETRDLLAGYADRPASSLASGERVGPYELERLLGSGGMAEVWLAKRADGSFKRQVALKLPMVSRFRQDLEERFIRERDILASLEHPNIARLYDGGVDAQGLPYLAMEYVAGTALTVWCDDRRLGVAERLRLVRRVLAAVQYAHERRVVHRDLKPSNILVTDSGEVRLLDFGVAKLLQETEGTQLTRLYGRALTPEYSSPEQLKGDPIDERSDVYSVGVLLYELLTGQRPYALNARASLGALEQALATVEVRRPSTQLKERAAGDRGMTQAKLADMLRGDLDVIALKALAKEPSERYRSAAAMAEDIARYLEHRPIKARPTPVLQRVHKFLQRNRAMIAVSALAGIVVVAVGGYELAHRLGSAAAPSRSIAVLPLANASGDAGQQYFSDGISEDLIAALTQFPGLKVIGRSSAFRFRDSKEDSRSIGAKLGVAHLLEGSVQHSGDMVRVSVELVDAADGSTQWSGHYDRPSHDLFALQDQIVRAVGGALKVKLVPGAEAAEQSDRPPSGNLEAYNALLEGRFYAARNTEADYRKAIEYFTRATELDPNYALAWSSLSFMRAGLAATFLVGAQAQEAYAKSRAAADRALALSPKLAEAHLASGLLFQLSELDWRRAGEEFRKAEELAPNDAVAKAYVGRQLATFGEMEAAIEITRRALATEPLRANWHFWLATYLAGANRLDEAEQTIRTALELQPASAAYHLLLTTIEIQRGRTQAALETAQQEAPGVFRDAALALARQIGSDRDAADAALKTLIEKDASSAPYQIAQAYALRSDVDATFEWLDRALVVRDPGVNQLLFDPFISRYRQDPRFAALCRKLGLPVPNQNFNRPASSAARRLMQVPANSGCCRTAARVHRPARAIHPRDAISVGEFV